MFRRLLPIAILGLAWIQTQDSLAASNCEKWFAKRRITPGVPDCVVRCQLADLDMGTFDCPLQCEKLCKTVLPRNLLDEYAYPPGLTDAEKDLIAKYPVDAAKIYKAKMEAEKSVERLFGGNFRNDESDAVRHFLWSAYSADAVGSDRAQMFLEAHETNKHQSSIEKKMDTTNNERGLQTFDRLRRNDQFSQANLEMEALRELKAGTLVVVKPRGNIPTWRK